MKYKATILFLFCLFISQKITAQMKDPVDWLNYENTMNVKNNQRFYDFDVYCIRSSAPANILWPHEKAKFTFQVVNNTNASISVNAKIENIRYGSRGIPNDIWLPEMFKIEDVQSIPVKIDIVANGFTNI